MDSARFTGRVLLIGLGLVCLAQLLPGLFSYIAIGAVMATVALILIAHRAQ